MKRDPNLDLIRAAAVVLLLFLHFIMGSGWYDMPNLGFAHWVMNLLRALFINCVPLFLLLTGYLCCRRELSARYYLGLVRIYVVYLLSCCASLLGRRFLLGESMGLREMAGAILNHHANAYSWYVVMYTGLFLMIPFLNLAFQGLGNRSGRLALVWTMIFLSAGPTLLNIRVHLYEVWWEKLYPLAYYFIGAYLREYRRPLRTGRLALGLLAALAGSATLNYFVCSPGSFAWMDYSWYQGFEVMGCSVLVFLLLLNLDLSRTTGLIAGGIRLLSRLSFEIYLFSDLTDMAVYRLGQRLIPAGESWMWAYALCAAASLLLCIPLAWLAERLAAPLIRWISRGLTRAYRRLVPGTAES